jgi:hypothetical protein
MRWVTWDVHVKLHTWDALEAVRWRKRWEGDAEESDAPGKSEGNGKHNDSRIYATDDDKD